jgi:arsenate reductase-like glutaredoxin family protein
VVVIQIYGRKKCKDTRKAERFFKERGVQFQFVDLDQKAPGRREIELFLEVLGEDEVLDTEGKAYQKRGLAYMDFDAAEELEEHPELFRTPIVRDGRNLAAGSAESFWRDLAGKS